MRAAYASRMRSYLLLARLPLSSLLAATLVFGGCHRDGPESPGAGSKGSPSDESAPVPEHTEGTPERLSEGNLRLSEEGIAAARDQAQLELSVPVSAGDDSARGALHVELINAEGSEVLDEDELSYALEAGEETTLKARLRLPEASTDQADLVHYSVRIRGEDDDGIHVLRSVFTATPHLDARLVGPARVTANRGASYRVRAQNAETQEAIASADVALSVKTGAGDPQILRSTTDEQGDAFFEVELTEGGQAALSASLSSAGTQADLASMVKVESSGARVLLTSDKPLYQPGQVVHLRALNLSRLDNAPRVAEPVVFEIEDAKANKVFKRTILSDAYGIAATTFRVGTLVNLGTFKARAVLGAIKSERTFEVARYALPKFKLTATPDKTWYRAAETVKLGVDARYFFGKNVANADVVLEGKTYEQGSVFQRVMGKTDAQGHTELSLSLPGVLTGVPLQQGNALLSLSLKATDAAGQVVEKTLPVVAAAKAAQLTLVPEGTELVPGVENRLLVFVTDPVGAPMANVTVSVTGAEAAVTTDAFGQAQVTLPADAMPIFLATATLPGGEVVSQSFSFKKQSGPKHVLVRTDRAVYAVGDTITVDVVSDAASDNIYVEWQNEGQTIAQRTVKAKDGKASFQVELDSGFLGSNRVEAYVVDQGGGVVRAGRTLFVRSDAALSVGLATDKPQYAPGEPAKLTFSVKDANGAPQVAALGLQIVDEALFALSGNTPGLLRSYFELEDEFSTPSYQIAVPAGSLPELVFQGTAQGNAAAQNAAQRTTQALFCGVGSNMVTGLHLSSWTSTQEGVKTRLRTLLQKERTRLAQSLEPTVQAHVEALKAEGCTPSMSYCYAQTRSFASALSVRLRDKVQVIDLWGQAYTSTESPLGIQLSSKGPDEKSGTWDDQSLSISFSDFGINASSSNPTAQAPAAAGGFGGTVAGVGLVAGGGAFTGGAGAGTVVGGVADAGASVNDTAEESAGARVRRDFPETLYVNPALITGPDGTATVEVPLADSITQWRVTSLANSKDGKLGGATHGVTVFQEFFADINFPAELTRGDEINFPVAIYNYLDQAQTVTLTLESGGWYTARGATTATVQLAANAVGGASFPVRVDQVGLQTLRVRAQGSTRADVVERKVRVVPDGKRFSSALSGTLGAGIITQTVSIPDTLVPNSGELSLSIYPAFTASVVSGMDSLLRVPYGCFEQTTSTTWPNVLVQRYLGETGQLSTETRLKAESYISAGYQRLVTFEHPNGGFSWFGTQDPMPNLSVTAFGVMEFFDMSKVYAVDPAMLARTVAWLSAQQQQDGSFTGAQTEFFSFNTSVLRNTAFVAWALATAGESAGAVTRALAYLTEHYASETQDAYTLALVANAFAIGDANSPTLSKVVTKLSELKKGDGDSTHWDSGGTQTQFYGQGRDSDVAATALAVHALLQSGGSADLIRGGITYLSAQRDQQGNFGSTQATIWTLRTLLLAASKGSEGAVGTLSVVVDGSPFNNLPLTQDQADVLTTFDLSSLASAGTHQVVLNFSGTGKLSYNLVSSYNLPWNRVPAPATTPLSVAVAYDRSSLPVNELAKATLTVRNLTASTQNMVLVDVGIPPGFEVQSDDLDLLRSQKKISKYELTQRQLILYISAIPARGSLALSYNLRATLPVRAADGGAKVYPYYEPARKQESASTTLEVL
jgi:uncharacterized protein YfaS (alpha-2-macroglobulin family)